MVLILCLIYGLLICRCNTSLLIDYCQADGSHHYILIDVGKTFREQVLRWFTHHRIPRVDSVSCLSAPVLICLKSIMIAWNSFPLRFDIGSF